MTGAASGSTTPIGNTFADATPAQIRAALTVEDAAAFDRQWCSLMARATERLDLADVHEAVETWRRVAWVTTAHGADAYARTVAAAHDRLRTGERAPGAAPWHQLRAGLGLPARFALS